MSAVWTDLMYALKEELLASAKKTVNDRLKTVRLSDEEEEELRQSMTEDIRFWKGW